MQERWELTPQRCNAIIRSAEVVAKMERIVSILPQRESHVIPLLALETDAERAAVWQEVIRERDGQPVRASDVEAAVARPGQPSAHARAQNETKVAKPLPQKNNAPKTRLHKPGFRKTV